MIEPSGNEDIEFRTFIILHTESFQNELRTPVFYKQIFLNAIFNRKFLKATCHFYNYKNDTIHLYPKSLISDGRKVSSFCCWRYFKKKKKRPILGQLETWCFCHLQVENREYNSVSPN